MPGYIRKELKKYQHAITPCPKHQPYTYTPIQYGAKIQHVVEPYTSAPLTKNQIKNVQDIVGTLLYYGRAFDPTIVIALSAIESSQAKGTEAVLSACHHLLDYLSTHPNSAIRYHASDRIIALNTDACYLSEKGGKSEPLHKCSSPRNTNHIYKMASS